ncbi:MAG: hypothetical protein ACOC5F_03275 [Candidatus Aminicenantaceae bacterium]
MIVVVNDASILFDILETDISDEFFCLPFKMYTSDLVSSEIKGEFLKLFQNYVRNKMINIYNFSSEEWNEVVDLSHHYPTVSQSDCSCLWLCQHLSAMLLTGDKKLKNVASGKHIRVHGTIWIFEQLISHKKIRPREASNKLDELIKINPRLPRNECFKKIKEWKS